MLLPMVGNTKPFLPPLMNLSAKKVNNVFVVDKAQQMLYLLKSEGPERQEIVNKIRITTGQAQGNKEREGDLKTPEGVYFIVNKIPGERLPAKYGPVAYVLNYPNTVDRIFHRTGSNIWLHGRDVKIQDFQTEGCISMDNDTLVRLANAINLQDTPVIIMDSLQTVDDSAYVKSLAAWKQRLATWRNAWESGDTATYFKMYSREFQEDVGQNFAQFRARKTRLEKVYSWKEVDVDNAIILGSDEETVVSFNQTYYCPAFYGRGIKHLYFVRENDQWKIIAEDYAQSEPALQRDQFLSAFVRKWKNAWESGDLDKYIAFYDTTYNDGERNYTEWKEYKSNIFAQTNRIQVNTTDLRFRNIGPAEWEVVFTQAYHSEDYSDFGQKTLRARGRPDIFKIYFESWTPIKSHAEN